MVEGTTRGAWQAEHQRLTKLVASGIALTSELALDDLLEKLVQTAAELTEARYAAIGVLDRTGTALERFITFGVDDETRRRIGGLPRGRGILGVLIDDAQPLRLSDLSQDPRSVGFPPGHPPMTSFLGVPVTLRGVAFGNLYLTAKAQGAEFTQQDEELAVLLASQAAVAIENARLYESATTWMRQLESLGKIGRDLTDELDSRTVSEHVCKHVRELVDAETALVALVGRDGTVKAEAIVGDAAEAFRSARMSLRESKAGRVLQRGRAERIDSTVDDPEIDQRLARQLAIHSALMVPMRARGEPLGLLMVFNRRGADGRFTDNDLRLAELFADRAAQALDLTRRVSRDTLSRVVAAEEAQRRRLSREVHDGAGQMLAAILMGVRRASRADSDGERDEAHAHVVALVEETVESLRRLSHQLHPRTLELDGLGPAISAIVAQFPPSDLSFDVASDFERRLDLDIELALFRVAQEAITNVVKHANATRVGLSLDATERVVSLLIDDDGIGFDPDALDGMGLGLFAMRERIEGLGGTLQIESKPGSGTSVRARVPLS